MAKDIVTKYIDLDMSILLSLKNVFSPTEKLELKMLEFYKFYQDEYNNVYKLFTKWLLNHLFMDNVDHPLHSIEHFYTLSTYNNAIITYCNRLDMIILVKSKLTSFINIEFDSYVVNTPHKIVVKFKVEQYGR